MAGPHPFPEVDLSAPALMTQAEEDAGLSDWGGRGFEIPLGLYLDSVHASANLHHNGRFLMFQVLRRLLANRLQIRRDRLARPEIRQTPIPRPLFILGLPRTGTTLLHNLLAQDPQARYLRLSEVLFPSPPPDPAHWPTDPRVQKTVDLCDMFHALAPRLATAHALNPLGAEECLWLFEHGFVDMIHELRAHAPDYSDYVARHEGDPAHYRDYRALLQALGSRWPGRHWVFKAPRHLLGLSGLLSVFPDARVVQTHRDPVEAVPSLCSLCEIDRGLFTDQPDRAAIGDAWLRRLSRGMTQALAARDADAPERYVDVDYRRLVAEPIDTVKDVYRRHGYEYTAEFEARLKAWIAANSQNKHGKHAYRLSDYGLKASDIRSRFSEYARRFRV